MNIRDTDDIEAGRLEHRRNEILDALGVPYTEDSNQRRVKLLDELEQVLARLEAIGARPVSR